MKPKLLIIYLLLTTLPIAMLAWIGIRLVRSEATQVEQGLNKLYVSRLKDYDVTISKVLDSRSRRVLDLSAELPPGFAALELRQRMQREPLVKQFFVVNNRGQLEYPTPTMPLSNNERQFLIRTSRIWTGGLIPANAPGPEQPPQNDKGKTNGEPWSSSKINKSAPQTIEVGSPRQVQDTTESLSTGSTVSGWITWYWESGVHLLYWVRLTDGRVVGAEFDRASLMSDMITELPLTDPYQDIGVEERVRLLNASDQLVYQWGLYEPPDDAIASAELSLSAPLSSWTFRYFPGESVAPTEFTKSRFFTLALTLLALVVVFIVVAVYLFREHSRDLREAATRVSFVNRVSHELKTPLTNIRMYAELLAPHLDDEDKKASERLAVITGETERLSRLIANVLTFSKHDKDTLTVCRQPNVIDTIVTAVLDRFELAFTSAGIVVETSLEATHSVNIDSDALEQILTNLLSNIEKYAASGKRAEVTTSLDGDQATIIIADNGPGIPDQMADTIFKPFYRLTDSLNEGTSGTGIGLGIARELARLHGGDICTEPSPAGARFVITLYVGDGEI